MSNISRLRDRVELKNAVTELLVALDLPTSFLGYSVMGEISKMSDEQIAKAAEILRKHYAH